MKSFLDNLKIGGVFLMAGLVAFAVSYTTFKNNEIKAGEITVEGKLISIDQNRLHAGKAAPGSKIVNYPATVEYKDQSGKIHQLNITVPSAPMPPIGSSRTVAYNQSSPEQAHEVSDAGNIIAYIALGSGIVLFTLGLVLTTGIMQKKHIN